MKQCTSYRDQIKVVLEELDNTVETLVESLDKQIKDMIEILKHIAETRVNIVKQKVAESKTHATYKLQEVRKITDMRKRVIILGKYKCMLHFIN